MTGGLDPRVREDDEKTGFPSPIGVGDKLARE